MPTAAERPILRERPPPLQCNKADALEVQRKIQ
jgi:hypothetical protein